MVGGEEEEEKKRNTLPEKMKGAVEKIAGSTTRDFGEIGWVDGRVSTTRGNPTVGGPLVGFLFENPHFPRGYRVGPTSNSPTQNFTEWVNKLTFL